MQKLNQPAFYLNGTVTDDQQRFFNKHGLIQFKNFVSRETARKFIEEIEKIQDYLLNRDIKTINGIPLKIGKDVDGSPLIQRMAFASQYSDVLSRFVNSDQVKALIKLLEPYEGRISENEKDGLVVNHFLNIESGTFSQMGWHTDSPRDIFLGSRILPMLNVGVHLDNCPMANGGLRVLPGTHNKGWRTLFFKKRYYTDKKTDPDERGLDIECGDVTVHDGRIWHRVQQSPFIGEPSRRRVMYIPIITGKYKPKNSDSVMPFYHKLDQWMNFSGGLKKKKK
jgi:phytanoyl-CoA hydroxylase